MLKHKLLYIVGFVLISLMVGAASAQPHTQDKQVVQQNQIVAILVVDSFTIPPSEDAQSLVTAEDNCVYSSSGQDGSHWGGLASLPPEFMALLGTHGDAVFNTVTGWLSAKGFDQSQVVLDDVVPYPLDDPNDNVRGPIFRMEYWANDSPQEILVIGVDTDNYNTIAVRDNMAAVVDYFSGNPIDMSPIDKFVINMSFAILGCGQIPYLSVENLVATEARIEGATNLQSYLAQQTTPQTLDSMREAVGDDYFAGVQLYYWLTTARRAVNTALYAAYDGRITAGPGDCDTLMEDILNDATENYVLGDSNLLGLFAAWQRVSRETVGGNLVPSCQLADYIETHSEDYPDYFAQLQQDYATFSDRGLQIIPVAASGNGWKIPSEVEGQPPTTVHGDFPYAPAVWPGVISVSADYTLPDGCVLREDINVGTVEAELTTVLNEVMADTVTGLDDADIEELTTEFQAPQFNDGEVMMNGVLKLFNPTQPTVPTLEGTAFGCVNGTSFSAPRLSADAGIYLLEDGKAVCLGSFPSNPALAHLEFDNLSPADASTEYCTNWGNKVPDVSLVFPP